MPSTVSSRPLTFTSLPLTSTKRSTRARKRCTSRKLPSKTNENGSVAKPAVPTTAPGGRADAATCEAGAALVLVPVDDDAPPDAEPEPAPAPLAGLCAAAPDDEAPPSLIERNLTFAP